MSNMIKKQVLSADKKHLLKGVVFMPQGLVKGYFHVVHGMTEHIGRYYSFMEEMAQNGYICFGFDNLGHGNTAQKGEHGFIAEKDGYLLLAEDVKNFYFALEKEYGQLPYYLMGHSMGSFIVRLAAQKYIVPQKLIIMGTGDKPKATDMGIFIGKIIKALFGPKHYSAFIERCAFSAYNERFKEENDVNSWLTTDKGIREKYSNDPYCNFKFTISAMLDLMMLNDTVNRDVWYKSIEKTMPVLLVSGMDDPVGDYGEGVKRVYNKLKAVHQPVEMKLYENVRHEILNDTSRAQVIKDILEFIR